jgi:ATP-dependent 26S proteasome regulatory subunit
MSPTPEFDAAARPAATDAIGTWLAAHRFTPERPGEDEVVDVGGCAWALMRWIARARLAATAGRMGGEPLRPLLLTGGAGSGKSWLASHAAYLLGREFDTFRVSVGELTPRLTRTLVDGLAGQSMPSLLVLEGLGALAAPGAVGACGWERAALREALLDVLEAGGRGTRPLVIATSVLPPEALDPRLTAAHRVIVARLPLPSLAEREALLARLVAGRAIDPATDWQSLAKAAHGMSPGDLRALVDRALWRALEHGRASVEPVDVRMDLLSPDEGRPPWAD